MQLEELQQQWQRLDEKLERTLNMDSEILRLTVTRPARQRMNRSAIWPALDVAFCLAILLVTAPFLGRHWPNWSLVGPTVVVIMAAIALMIDSIRQLIRVSEINWSGSVVDIQSSLSRLHMAKIRQFKWVILLSPLVWICGLIVGLQWLMDWAPEPHFILDKLSPAYVAGNYAFGVLFIVFGHAIVRFLAARFGNRGWWQRALADISGSSMKKTTEELERWASLNDKVSNTAA